MILSIIAQQVESQLSVPSIFVVRGTVYAADRVTYAGDGFKVTVKNVTKGLSLTDITGLSAGPSQYAVTFVDFTSQVVTQDDLIQVNVTQGITGKVLATKQVSVTEQDIRASSKVINVAIAPVETQILAIRGTIFAYDDVTLAGDGFRVTVTNVSKKITGTNTTGAVAGSSKYGITFISIDQPVASFGDKIEVQVEDNAILSPLTKKNIVITPSDITQGFVMVNITIPSFPWDINKDRMVNLNDLVLVGKNLGQQVIGTLDLNPDVNRDGVANILDMVIIARNFGKSY